jgi:hypothetical protein
VKHDTCVQYPEARAVPLATLQRLAAEGKVIDNALCPLNCSRAFAARLPEPTSRRNAMTCCGGRDLSRDDEAR